MKVLTWSDLDESVVLDEDGVGRQVAVDDGRRARVKVAAEKRVIKAYRTQVKVDDDKPESREYLSAPSLPSLQTTTTTIMSACGSCVMTAVRLFKATPDDAHLRRCLAFFDALVANLSATEALLSETRLAGRPAALSKEASDRRKKILSEWLSWSSWSHATCFDLHWCCRCVPQRCVVIDPAVQHRQGVCVRPSQPVPARPPHQVLQRDRASHPASVRRAGRSRALSSCCCTSHSKRCAHHTNSCSRSDERFQQRKERQQHVEVTNVETRSRPNRKRACHTQVFFSWRSWKALRYI